MRGPYVFGDKDPNQDYLYEVGDWVHGDSNDLWKIRSLGIMDGQKYYHVCTYLLSPMREDGLRNYGDTGALETDIHPITDQSTILLCRASDIKAKQHKLLEEAEKLGQDFDALMRTRELIKGERCS